MEHGREGTQGRQGVEVATVLWPLLRATHFCLTPRCLWWPPNHHPSTSILGSSICNDPNSMPNSL